MARTFINITGNGYCRLVCIQPVPREALPGYDRPRLRKHGKPLWLSCGIYLLCFQEKGVVASEITRLFPNPEQANRAPGVLLVKGTVANTVESNPDAVKAFFHTSMQIGLQKQCGKEIR